MPGHTCGGQFSSSIMWVQEPNSSWQTWQQAFFPFESSLGPSSVFAYEKERCLILESIEDFSILAVFDNLRVY